jgi:hypothetical protein
MIVFLISTCTTTNGSVPTFDFIVLTYIFVFIVLTYSSTNLVYGYISKGYILDSLLLLLE